MTRQTRIVGESKDLGAERFRSGNTNPVVEVDQEVSNEVSRMGSWLVHHCHEFAIAGQGCFVRGEQIGIEVRDIGEVEVGESDAILTIGRTIDGDLVTIGDARLATGDRCD